MVLPMISSRDRPSIRAARIVHVRVAALEIRDEDAVGGLLEERERLGAARLQRFVQAIELRGRDGEQQRADHTHRRGERAGDERELGDAEHREQTRVIAKPRATGASSAGKARRRIRIPPGPSDVATRMIPPSGRRRSRPVEISSKPIAVCTATPTTVGWPAYGSRDRGVPHLRADPSGRRIP